MKYRIDKRADPCGQPVYMVQGLVGIFRKQWIDLTVSGLPAYRFGGASVTSAATEKQNATLSFIHFNFCCLYTQHSTSLNPHIATSFNIHITGSRNECASL